MALVAGCGSSSSGSASAGSTYAKQAPSRIVADAARAMAAATSYRAAGATGASGYGNVAVHIPGSISAVITSGSQAVRLIVVPGGSYLNANGPFWTKHGGGLSAKLVAILANRWFRTPTAMARSLTGSFSQIAPKQQSVCMAQAMVKPTFVKTTTLAGQPVVELHTNGGVPGDSPGNLYVAAHAPHYPLRFEQTGKALSGGSVACAGAPSSKSKGSGSVDFSDWNAVTISAPAHASKLP